MRDINLLLFECPYCQECFDVHQWNEEVKNSIIIGRAEEIIPESMTVEEWEAYALKHSGSAVDCPACQKVCCFEDLNIV